MALLKLILTLFTNEHICLTESSSISPFLRIVFAKYMIPLESPIELLLFNSFCIIPQYGFNIIIATIFKCVIKQWDRHTFDNF